MVDQRPRSNRWVASAKANWRRPRGDGNGDRRLNGDCQSHTQINGPNHIDELQIGKTKGAGPLHIVICDQIKSHRIITSVLIKGAGPLHIPMCDAIRLDSTAL